MTAGGPDAEAPVRVLGVRLSAMGDLVHALPALIGLARARPRWHVALLTQRPLLPLLDGIDGLAEPIAHDRRPALRGLFATRRRLCAARFDVALDLQGNWKSALCARLSGAPRRIGIAAPWRRERASAMLLSEVVAAGRSPGHPAHLAADVVRALAADAEPDRGAVLRAGAAEIDAEAAAVRALGIDPDRPFAVLVAADPRDNRAWRPAALARAAAAAAPALVVAGPDEPFDLALPPSLPLLRHGRGELRRLVALGALVARSAGRVLGPDVGATHVLCASGAATQVLYGPQDPRCTAPLRAEVALRGDGPPCVPCRARACRLAQGPVCMDFVPPL